jgi:hypothetical protein
MRAWECIKANSPRYIQMTQHNITIEENEQNDIILSQMFADEILQARNKQSSQAALKDIIGEWL